MADDITRDVVKKYFDYETGFECLDESADRLVFSDKSRRNHNNWKKIWRRVGDGLGPSGKCLSELHLYTDCDYVKSAFRGAYQLRDYLEMSVVRHLILQNNFRVDRLPARTERLHCRSGWALQVCVSRPAPPVTPSAAELQLLRAQTTQRQRELAVGYVGSTVRGMQAQEIDVDAVQRVLLHMHDILPGMIASLRDEDGGQP